MLYSDWVCSYKCSTGTAGCPLIVKTDRQTDHGRCRIAQWTTWRQAVQAAGAIWRNPSGRWSQLMNSAETNKPCCCKRPRSGVPNVQYIVNLRAAQLTVCRHHTIHVQVSVGIRLISRQFHSRPIPMNTVRAIGSTWIMCEATWPNCARGL